MKKDNKFQCHYCKDYFDESLKTQDHKHPKGFGGKANPNNMVDACVMCNEVKGRIPYREFLNLGLDMIRNLRNRRVFSWSQKGKTPEMVVEERNRKCEEGKRKKELQLRRSA